MAEKKKKVSRRKFLVRGGLGTIGVLAVGTYLARNPIRRVILEAAESTIVPYSGSGTEASLWFELTKENKVLFHSPKVEMGQGIFTAFSQMIADEMDVSMDQVIVQAAATDTGIVDGMSTGGSLSVAALWQPLRELAAMMREMIKTEAARKMGVEVASLTTKEGKVSGGGKSMTYAEVAEGVTEWTEPSDQPMPKTSGFKHVGKPIPRVDLNDKVFGAPIYGLDAEMPDMLYAAITRPDIVGATFKNADMSKASKMPGVVKVVQIDDWVGVVAKSYSEALAAKRTLNVEWNVEKVWTEEELRDLLQVGKGDSQVQQKDGSALSEDDEDAIVLEFTSPIGAHAQLEPNGAVANWEGDKLTLILSTQVIGVTQNEVARALEMEKENINIVPTHLGGGFGRRLETNHAIQAAQLSREVGKPVKYIFTRKEEFQNDQFRPPTHHIMKGKLDDQGSLKHLEHHYASGDVAVNSLIFPSFLKTVVGADIGAARGSAIMYDVIPNNRTVQWHTTLPFATSWWRSLGLMANSFAIESMVDEMAIKAGKSPAEFRLNMLSNDETSRKIAKVIEVVVEKSGYNDKISNGRAMGLAASIDAGSPCAQVVEVSIKDGKIKVHKVTAAFDCGLAVNPDQVKAQVEGCIIMGMSASLMERMKLKNGSLQPTIYGPYEMAMVKHAPKEIDVHLVQGSDVPMPVGEPPLGPIAPAIANAVRRLADVRLTDIPLQSAYEKAVKEGIAKEIASVV